MKRRLLPFAAASVAAAALIASPAMAATAATDAQVSSNWAGYAATGTQYSKVSGTWVQPNASCDSGTGDAAFWVGLGGATGESNALEQAGTQADCSDGSPTYSAWYELVPAAPVTVDLAVKPGDTVATTVGVDGNQVSISMANKTTGKTFNKTLRMDQPDVSSAEWIAEAPSACQGSADGQCQTLPLADFGSVAFTDATATGGGQTGSIADWQATPMQLSPSASGGLAGGQFGAGYGGGAADGTSSASAVPSTLSSDGTGFSVAWQSADDAQTGGDSYGNGGGYGDGGYGYDGGGYGGGGGYGYGGGYEVVPYGYGAGF